MKTENTIKIEAMNILLKHLGPVDTARFFASICREKFDYTEWQKTLWEDKTVDEIYQMGVELEKTMKK